MRRSVSVFIVSSEKSTITCCCRPLLGSAVMMIYCAQDVDAGAVWHVSVWHRLSVGMNRRRLDNEHLLLARTNRRQSGVVISCHISGQVVELNAKSTKSTQSGLTVLRPPGRLLPGLPLILFPFPCYLSSAISLHSPSVLFPECSFLFPQIQTSYEFGEL